MSIHKEIAETILKLLRETVPEVQSWQYNPGGFKRSTKAEGTLSSDTISFQVVAKDIFSAVVTYSIYVIDPLNKLDMINVMFKIHKVFIENNTLDGKAYNVTPLEVQMGVAQAISNSSAACFILEVEFDI